MAGKIKKPSERGLYLVSVSLYFFAGFFFAAVLAAGFFAAVFLAGAFLVTGIVSSCL